MYFLHLLQLEVKPCNEMTIVVLVPTDLESLETPVTAPSTHTVSLKTNTADAITTLKYILRKIFECMDIFMSQYVA